MTSCSVENEAPRSVEMLGSATFTIETSSNCMNTAINVAVRDSQAAKCSLR